MVDAGPHHHAAAAQTDLRLTLYRPDGHGLNYDGWQRLAARVGIGPTEFWALTPRQVMLWHDGYVQQQQDIMRREAWKMSHVLAMVSGKAIDPLVLLGERTAAPDIESPEDFAAMMRARRQREKYGEL